MLLSIALNMQLYLPEPPLVEGLCSSFFPGSGGLASGQSGYALFCFLGGTLRAVALKVQTRGPAWASRGSLLEMQILRPTSDSLNKDLGVGARQQSMLNNSSR